MKGRSKNKVEYQAVHWAVSEAANWTVDWAVSEAANWTVRDAVFWTVDGAVDGAVWQEPEHSALQDYLGEAR